MLRALAVMWIATVVLTAASVVDAQAPDVVRTHDGGFVRGTIIENVPGDHVSIQLPTGAVRTIAASDVEYAGAFTAEATPTPEPAPRSTAPSRDAQTWTLTLGSDYDDIMFYAIPLEIALRTRVAYATRPLCSAPCSVDVHDAVLRLAYAHGRGDDTHPVRSTYTTQCCGWRTHTVAATTRTESIISSTGARAARTGSRASIGARCG